LRTNAEYLRFYWGFTSIQLLIGTAFFAIKPEFVRASFAKFGAMFSFGAQPNLQSVDLRAREPFARVSF
jgi:hypothetical protein